MYEKLATKKDIVDAIACSVLSIVKESKDNGFTENEMLGVYNLLANVLTDSEKHVGSLMSEIDKCSDRTDCFWKLARELSVEKRVLLGKRVKLVAEAMYLNVNVEDVFNPKCKNKSNHMLGTLLCMIGKPVVEVAPIVDKIIKIRFIKMLMESVGAEFDVSFVSEQFDFGKVDLDFINCVNQDLKIAN